MLKTTRKKVKVVGSETYINQQTGEIQEMQVINVEERDANFHKIWLTHVIQTLDIIGNQKIKLAFWLLENLDSENKITMTYRQMADRGNFSYDTVCRTMKALIDSDFVKPINRGAYRVNPDVLFKGGKNKRLNILVKYHNEE